MIRQFFWCCGKMVRLMLIAVTLFLLLCMNVFTIPLFVLCWLFCKLFRLRTPRFGGYGFMVYPRWSDKPHKGMMDDIREVERKHQAKIKRYTPIRAWEERFF